MEKNELECMLEGILFAAGEPVKISRLAAVTGADAQDIRDAARTLAGQYRFGHRGIRLAILDDRLQLTSSPELGDLIRRVLEDRKPPPMSRAAIEILALAAYYQPITRAHIEKVRGVESGATVANLCEKGLLEEAGRMDVPGKPILYRTTPVFLRSFGLQSLDELPEAGELEGQLTIREGEPQAPPEEVS